MSKVGVAATLLLTAIRASNLVQESSDEELELYIVECKVAAGRPCLPLQRRGSGKDRGWARLLKPGAWLALTQMLPIIRHNRHLNVTAALALDARG
jgi:hypothetical protein